MKTLIVEDDCTSRLLLEEILKRYGPIHVAVNGREGVDAVLAAVGQDEPYDLICLDIMMPDMDGYQALKEIRALENSRGLLPPDCSRIFMTTALDNVKDVSRAFYELCDAYLIKPINKAKLLEQLHEFGLLSAAPVAPKELVDNQSDARAAEWF